ncbi:hypothetical protein AAH991_24195 [Microbispora sp. ZYX-F-249]|uniref:Barstar (barnase inhibitor) domain-containing protein n=1 Tax=Microbispora maris TaxID=3144104 RepID=A0ABV0AUG1_9ACTN
MGIVDLSKLPQADGWMTTADGFDVRAFLLANVTVGEAAALSLLFWPEFVEYRDCVFLGALFDKRSVDTWFEELKGDRSAVENVVNHLHLWDVFAPRSESEYAILPEVASRVAAMWRAALRDAFPAREFVVAVLGEEGDYGPTVSFRSA